MAEPLPSRRVFGALALTVGAAACATDPLMAGAPPGIDTGDWDGVLIAEHRAVDALLTRLVDPATSPAQARALAQQIKTALTRHALREENVIYPQLRLRGAEPQAQDLFKDHADLKTLLAVINTRPPTEPDWRVAAERLATETRAHVLQEEREIFPPLKAALTQEQNDFYSRLVRMEGAKYRA